MWFVWDGESIRFTHTNTRRKYGQLQNNPHLAISVIDPDDPARYVEVRAKVVALEDDPTAAQYTALAVRYGRGAVVPPDAADRVIIVAVPYHCTTMG